MKAFVVILGIILATTGGVIAYRALYLDPKSGVVITDKGVVREIPNYTRVVGGTVLLVGGAALAFFGATRRGR